MASPLQFHGGFQITGNPSGNSAILRFDKKSFQVIVDTVYSQKINLTFGGNSLEFINNQSEIVYDSTRMFLMF